MAKDADLFAKAMADVKPLDGRRRLARPALAKAAPTAVETAAGEGETCRAGRA